MNPIYKFELTAGNTTQRAFPIYKDDLAKDFEKESNQEFFRAKLSGKMTFESADYAFIVSKAFDTQFVLVIFISYDAGQTWASYWRGTFWKTDCDFDNDTQTVVVQPTVWDQYNAVLAGIEKEYNLLDLAPEIVPVKADKRPMVQVYVPGQSVIGCFLSGMWWEQECDPISDAQLLRTKYFFEHNKTYTNIIISGNITPELPGMVSGYKTNSWGKDFDFTVGNFRYVRVAGGTTDAISIRDAQTGIAKWTNSSVPADLVGSYTVNLSPVAGQGATGIVTLDIEQRSVFARFICDVDNVLGQDTNPIPDDDLVANNRNYSRVIPYDFESEIYFNAILSTTPTKWGIYQPGLYFQPPYSIYGLSFYPIARSAWGRVSIWFSPSPVYDYVEEGGRANFTLNDAYPLSSVISVLLAKIAPGITHAGTTDYSQFLYGTNLIGITQTLLITPKSNLVTSGYDQPAQKAPITLKNVLDMLRDCFRCYWFIDEQNRFCIEHISYFMNGGAYPGTPDFPKIGINLTEQVVTRNGKPWAFGRDQFSYDKPDMAARYEFGWMDDVTEPFEGNAIEIDAQFVNPENIERIDIANFTSDVDYILLNPSAISKDGFTLLAAVLESGEYKLPYYEYPQGNTTTYLQNGYVAFCYLQNYYAYDMPAYQYRVGDTPKIALGIKRLKKQTIIFPAFIDPQLNRLIKTNLGNGTIEKLSVNLSSRNANATLRYDTE